MGIQTAFPTYLYQAKLRSATRLNKKLLNEIKHLSEEDQAGLHWSATRYPNGYTSYGSLHRLHQFSPTFAQLANDLEPHVQAFARQLGLKRSAKLTMTDCWANVMTYGVHHGWHIHPQSVISGSYYVQTPPQSAPIQFEDPRLERLMAAPVSERRQRQLWLALPVRQGWLVLFESFLRHEVPINRANTPRVSVSFNYS
jgi:uncharacterized protein (TIGR02466 family)